MPPVESPPSIEAGAPPAATVQLAGWGGLAPARAARLLPTGPDALAEALADRARWLRPAGAIARGRGRSYGDAAQCDGGTVIDLRAVRVIELDTGTGIATVGAGVTLGELLSAVVSAGWIVPVVPGTQHVSVGGAIAADIHGKNHASALTFSRHVLALGLLTASGELLELTGGGSDPRFEATAGGMGLTGVIVWARIALRRARSAILSVDSDRVDDLDAAFELLDAVRPASGGGAPTGEYRVAWLDLLAGPEPRGVVTRADHVAADDGSLRPGTVTRGARLSVPDGFPGGLLRASSVRLHNELRWRLAPRAERGRPVPFAAHMFPLDVLGAWPRLYGPGGFLQYQFVVPRGHERTIRLVLARLHASRVPCFLAVLKDFGAATPSPLSFPLAGWTLALDLPATSPGLYAALDACDELVAGAGGRVYLAKDARLRPETLATMYPRLSEWRRVRDALDPDGVWRSDLAVRTALVEGR